jgi:undecaprenyl-diphosphatase
MTIFEAIIIAIVEGLTEFLPISSTGHMVITSTLLGIEDDAFTKTFEIAIQLGAILAVVVIYWRKFFDFTKWQFYVKLLVAVIPALALGALFQKQIDKMLESPLTVAITTLVGGIFLLFIDKIFNRAEIKEEPQITYKSALIIGFWQCLAMLPGTSRSAASIIGGMQQKLTRKLAAEFSFFLAVPTMLAATGFKLFNQYETIGSEHVQLLLIGNVVAFVVAILAIKFFIGFLQKYGFRVFGIYRVVLGIVLLILIWSGYL